MTHDEAARWLDARCDKAIRELTGARWQVMKHLYVFDYATRHRNLIWFYEVYERGRS